jgi:predicted ATPase/class 3 adenylate cyclase/DNA-binding SARP family transcriptional activator
LAEFGILGPLLVRGDDGEVRVTGARRRALLVRLLVAANELVPSSRLADDLWAGDPPAGSGSTLQSHVSLLRKAIGPDRIVGRDGGYVLDVADGELDARCFENEVRQGRAALADGDAKSASALLRRALDRWRGTALVDVGQYVWARPEQTRLEELQVGALETWLQSLLQLGQHREVVALAEAAVAEHPLSEELWGSLILALYRSGRQGDALRAYQRLRALLTEELGIEPSPPLVALDQAVIDQSPKLDQSPGLEGLLGAATAWASARRSAPLPSGTVTLLFSDVEGSTRLWENHPDEMQGALARHDELLRSSIVESGGHVFKTVGDAFCAVFASPERALAAAVAAQRELGRERWPEKTVLQVRMGLHSGVCQERDGDYFGPTVNRTARLAATAWGGQVVVSGATAALVADLVPEGVSLLDLGEHRLRDLGRPEQVFQLEAAGLQRDFPPLRSVTSAERRHNLPQALTSFVGRTRELADLRARLEGGRLVTLTGPGGAGKTRLALAAAAEQIEAHKDGVWLVELASVTDPTMVVGSVARLLAVQEEAHRPLEQSLADFLRERDALLVIDNCEHVLDTVSRLADTLLRSCPGLSVLATSREHLGVPGEAVVRIPPLSVPPEDAVDPVHIESFEAVRLFAERAASQQDGFAVDASNASVLAALCRRLEGIPLAIELAAVRVRTLKPQEILDRLTDRFRLLKGGGRARDPRHQTLLAAIDWSYDLLCAQEKAVFAGLAVFAGGWTLDAAEDVAAAEDVERWEVLDLLTNLVDKNLVHCEAAAPVSPFPMFEGVYLERIAALVDESYDGPPPFERELRYRLLDSVRDYAALKAADNRSALLHTRSAHLDHYLALVESITPRLVGPDQLRWTDRLETEIDNLRASFAFVLGGDDPTPGLRMGAALRLFWYRRGYALEGIELLTHLLDRSASPHDEVVRGWALFALTYLLGMVGDSPGARRRGEEALALARHLGDDRLTALVLGQLAMTRLYTGSAPEALEIVDEALALSRTLADPYVTQQQLMVRSLACEAVGDVHRARAHNQEALALNREIGDHGSVTMVLLNLGNNELQLGEVDAARRHSQESLGEALSLRDPCGVVYAMYELGLVELLDGGAPPRQVFVDAAILARRVGQQVLYAHALLCLACALSRSSETEAAAFWHGATDATFAAMGESPQPVEAGLWETDHEALRSLMGTGGFESQYRRGREVEAAELDDLLVALSS